MDLDEVGSDGLSPPDGGVHTSDFPPVVHLNVGGTKYVTLLSTLTKYPDSMIAAMFSGKHLVRKDKDGNYFIDRDGALFGCLLSYLRSGDCDIKTNVLDLFKESQFFGLKNLTDKLQFHPEVCRYTVKEARRAQFPNYEDTKQIIIQAAIKQASITGEGEVIVHVIRETRTDMFENHICIIECAHVIVAWCSPLVEDIFISCLTEDLQEDGFTFKPRSHILSRQSCDFTLCPKVVYKLTFVFE